MTDRKPQERVLTDSSLRHERLRTDEELEARAASLEESADEIVATARLRAEDVLRRAREREDAKLASGPADGATNDALTAERIREDKALRTEHAIADETLRDERAARRQVLGELLSREREQTDVHLRAERRLADRALDARDFVMGAVSHDARNLLSALSMGATALRLLPADGHLKLALDEESARIRRAVTSMTRLVGDLLDIVSIDAGKLAIVPKPKNAAELLDETAEAFQPIALSKGVTLRIEHGDGPLVGYYDHDRILQVLANLVGNALKFTHPGTQVSLRCKRLDGELSFTVHDDGPGIAPDHLERVFDLYWRADVLARPGIGLGLFISRSLVEAHGGRIWAESKPGEGTTFHFTVPTERR